jgi:indole-3-glycerol phosphate synthase
MTTLRLAFTALILSVLTEMPVPEGSYDSVSGVSQSADVPSEVRGG